MATGQPNSFAEGDHLVGRREHLGASRARPATPALSAAMAGADLVAHDLDGLGRRADEGHPALGDGPGEVGVLGEEAVAGVDGVGPALLDDAEDGLGVQVALGRGLAAQGVGLVGQPDVERVAVELGVDGHRGHPELAAGPDDPDGDLSPVGDENLLQHAAPFESAGMRRRSSPPRSDITLSRPVGCVPCRAPGSPTSGASTRSTRPTGTCSTRPGRGAADGVVAVADHQTAGRGRLGRRWEAPAGSNLLVSVLLRPELPARPAASGQRGGGPGRRRCRRGVAGLELGIKWPNDLLAPDGRKVAGVLAEADLAGPDRPGAGRDRRRSWSASGST